MEILFNIFQYSFILFFIAPFVIFVIVFKNAAKKNKERKIEESKVTKEIKQKEKSEGEYFQVGDGPSEYWDPIEELIDVDKISRWMKEVRNAFIPPDKKNSIFRNILGFVTIISFFGTFACFFIMPGFILIFFGSTFVLVLLNFIIYGPAEKKKRINLEKRYHKAKASFAAKLGWLYHSIGDDFKKYQGMMQKFSALFQLSEKESRVRISAQTIKDQFWGSFDFEATKYPFWRGYYSYMSYSRSGKNSNTSQEHDTVYLLKCESTNIDFQLRSNNQYGLQDLMGRKNNDRGDSFISDQELLKDYVMTYNGREVTEQDISSIPFSIKKYITSFSRWKDNFAIYIKDGVIGFRYNEGLFPELIISDEQAKTDEKWEEIFDKGAYYLEELVKVSK